MPSFHYIVSLFYQPVQKPISTLYLGMLAHLGCIILCGTLCSLTGNNRGQALLTCFASAVRCMMACIALFFGLAVTGTALLFMLGGV